MFFQSLFFQIVLIVRIFIREIQLFYVDSLKQIFNENKNVNNFRRLILRNASGDFNYTRKPGDDFGFDSEPAIAEEIDLEVDSLGDDEKGSIKRL